MEQEILGRRRRKLISESACDQELRWLALQRSQIEKPKASVGFVVVGLDGSLSWR